MSITPHSCPYLILKPTEKLPTKEQLGPDLFIGESLDKERKVSMETKSKKCRKFAVLS